MQIAGIHPSNMQFGYRKRVDFSCLKGRWGFLKKGSSEFIGIDRCLLADDAINDYIKNNSCMRKTRIEIDDKGRINQKQMYLDIGVGKPLTYRLGAFSQINRNINIKLIERITSIAKQTNSKTAIEFFCGIGNFTIPLSLNQISITALEWDKNAVLSLKDNIKAFGIKNIAIQRANLMQPFRINTEFDLAILDPPREGARYVAEWLRRRKVNWIIYVSCEPSTLARDLFMLKESYTIESVELFDMFPQTHHIETLVLLKLK
ncbi:class I SAM-dependent RNA methyltransferase [Hippea sp. KM1]|uniref:class I SAM-dependent RNA methyltransferase n=1 Tax=Hippea sp. KM1 TaxID=944481 RepID=UPI003FA56AD0